MRGFRSAPRPPHVDWFRGRGGKKHEGVTWRRMLDGVKALAAHVVVGADLTSISPADDSEDLEEVDEGGLPETESDLTWHELHMTPSCGMGTTSISDTRPVQWGCWGKSTVTSLPLAEKWVTTPVEE